MAKLQTNTDPRAALRYAVAGERMAARRYAVAHDRAERAAQILAEARAAVELHEGGRKGLEAEHAKALERWIKGGERGKRPAPFADPHGDRELVEAVANVQAAERTVARFREAEAGAAAHHADATAQLRDARGRVVAARIGEVVAELRGMWARERELMALVAAIGPGDAAAHHLSRSIDEVRCPPARPTIEDMVGGGHVVHGINSPIGGQRDLMDSAQDYWRDFLAAAEREGDQSKTNTAPPAREAAA
jgi:hypothetical protein